jgi:hypothetical protein
MLPSATAGELVALGHDAVAIRASGLTGASDSEVYAVAVAENRMIVTENFADFVRILEQCHSRGDACAPVVFVCKRDFARGGGLAARLARHLDRWATANPDPYPGVHWP